MARRAIHTLIVASVLVVAAGAQHAPYTRLLVAAQGQGAGQSLLLSVETATGKITTLLDQPYGTLTNITMDRDNIGYVLAYTGPAETGLHFLVPEGSLASLVRTERHRSSPDAFASVELTAEDCWLVGGALVEGRATLRRLESGGSEFVEIDSLDGAEVAEILVGRTAAAVTLGLNTTQGGALVSYDCHNVSQPATTLAAGLGTIADLVEDPRGNGFVVATRDPWAPFVFVSTVASRCAMTTLTLPTARFPNGLAVDAIAMDMRPDANGQHALWVLSADRLHRLTWDPVTKSLLVPATLITYRLPSARTSAMIFEGDRDFLLTSPKATGPNPGEGALLSLRLGPQYSGQKYVIAASFAMTPGIPVASERMINLRADPLFFLSVSGQLPMIFEAFQGETGPEGEVTGRMVFHRTWFASAQSLTVYFAGIVLDPAFPGQIRTVTNTVGVTLF